MDEASDKAKGLMPASFYKSIKVLCRSWQTSEGWIEIGTFVKTYDAAVHLNISCGNKLRHVECCLHDIDGIDIIGDNDHNLGYTTGNGTYTLYYHFVNFCSVSCVSDCISSIPSDYKIKSQPFGVVML